MNHVFSVQVRVMSATDLRAANGLKGTSDPYVTVRIQRTGEIQTTSVCLNTVNPCWYHNLIFNDVHRSDILEAHVYDQNLYIPNAHLGCARIGVGAALAADEKFLCEAERVHSVNRHTTSYLSSTREYNQTSCGDAEPCLDHYAPSAPPASPPSQSTTQGSTFHPISPYPFTDIEAPIPHRPPRHSSFYDCQQKSVHEGRNGLDQYVSVEGASVQHTYRPSGANQEQPAYADSVLQRAMTSSYPVHPQGKINIVVASDRFFDLGLSAPRSYAQRFQAHKFCEQAEKVGETPFATKIVHTVGSVLNRSAQMVKPIHPAFDLFQPVPTAFQEHSTWKIEMREVVGVFGSKRQGWNRNYPAAQRIFEGRTSVISRKIVQMQHAYLYGGAGSVKPLILARKNMMEATGNLIDGEDFLALMEFGIRKRKSRMFTYVLMPERLYMAETSAEFFRDMMSKHAMHSSASPEVVYAGELHFQRSQENAESPRYLLVLDNNSGTYSPRKEDLRLVEQVFRRNFPGLDVIALDFQDPQLAEYKSRLLQRSSAS